MPKPSLSIADPDPFGNADATRLQAMCQNLGIQCLGFKDTVMHEAPEVLAGTGQPYRVYTPYSGKWLRTAGARSLPRPAAPWALPPRSPACRCQRWTTWGLTLPAKPCCSPWSTSARDRMSTSSTAASWHVTAKIATCLPVSTGSCLGQDLRLA